MSRLALLGGAYRARSPIANAQRCINYYPEVNPKDSPSPVTHYQRPGLRALTGVGGAPYRALYRATNGQGYGVIGQNVYAINADWTNTLIGTLVTPSDSIVSMIDNGIEVFLVDGSSIGYQWNLSGALDFAQIVDPTGTFIGATKIDYLDTFFLWNSLKATQEPANLFGSSLSNEIVFDGLYVAAKTTYADPIVSIAVCKSELILVGSLKSEIWFDAGNAGFPFARLPGANIEHGTCAAYSVCQQDISVYWLSQDLQGQGLMMRVRGYQCERISNHALEYAMQQIVKSGNTLSDCRAYTYQQGGHVFAVFNFVSGDQTWVFDEATSAWHQRAWTDVNGELHRERAQVAAFINGLNVVGDWENGTLYALDPDVYTDTVLENAGPITFIRSFPHLDVAKLPNGQLGDTDGRRVQCNRFVLDMDCGASPGPGNGFPSEVTLRWSTTRGNSFGNGVLQSAGEPGQYETYPQWLEEGIARDFVFEIQHSINGPASLQGAWVDAKLMDS